MSKKKPRNAAAGDAPIQADAAAERAQDDAGAELTGGGGAVPGQAGAEAEQAGADALFGEAELREQLQAKREEAAQNYDRYVRTQAELQNVLKRHERDRSDRVKYAAEALGRDLLSVVDDLERALAHGGEAGDGVIEGVRMVRGGLLAALERHGIERLDAVGKPFDPSEHEAVMTIESDEHAPNTVVEEHRPGYRIHDRLLRAAMVAVSKAPADDDK
jgi:molecular chaperone GrpE